MIKLTIRENGFGTPQWWKNFISEQSLDYSLSYLSEQDKIDLLRGVLLKMNIRFCMSKATLDVWLEFETEQDKNWFILKWS